VNFTQRLSRRASTILVPSAFGAVFFGLWEWMVRAFDIKQFLLPSPSSIYTAVGDNAQRIWDGVEITGGNAVYGLVVGSIVAILAALLSSRWSWFSDLVTPLASGMAAVPIVSLAPVFNIWFGSTNSFSRRLVVIVVVFFPVFVNVTKGLTQVDSIHLELMRSRHPPSPDPERVALPDVFAATREFVGDHLRDRRRVLWGHTRVTRPAHYSECWSLAL
jgi:ABC-type nitrate/sulfonate/bicarbonate transport system permease component